MTFSNKKILILFVVIVTVLLSLFAFLLLQAQSPNFFGGFVTTSIYCTCSNNFLLTIGPPVGGQFIYQPGTPQYPYHSLPRAGVWALGLYSPGGICLMFVGKGCSPFGAPIGTITPIVGTSL